MTATRRHGQRSFAYCALWMLRLLAFVLVAQLSEAAHTARDVALSVLAMSDCHESDCDDGAGEQCPPGCPNCHCAGRTSVIPVERFVPALLAETATQPEVRRWFRRERAHESPWHLAIYRPPRSARG